MYAVLNRSLASDDNMLREGTLYRTLKSESCGIKFSVYAFNLQMSLIRNHPFSYAVMVVLFVDSSNDSYAVVTAGLFRVLGHKIAELLPNAGASIRRAS
ncbi:hypothetical protein L1987_83734 [Smallanthus sonchifolius]|uniref:Uncharacterized protein n=1 Tax=Smallanthus sonchifolius TaxID=185202 RepID=A0ACB8YDB0_9ASTR|nr:hypothetical protein L1987_83734 [Smallanthus sonchifolius]